MSSVKVKDCPCNHLRREDDDTQVIFQMRWLGGLTGNKQSLAENLQPGDGHHRRGLSCCCLKSRSTAAPHTASAVAAAGLYTKQMVHPGYFEANPDKPTGEAGFERVSLHAMRPDGSRELVYQVGDILGHFGAFWGILGHFSATPGVAQAENVCVEAVCRNSASAGGCR